MEQCFRIVLWMFCLVGYLQAGPLKICYNVDDLSLNLTKEEVSCEQNVTFTSPTNVKSECYGAAMTVFIQELERAKDECTDEFARIRDIISILNLTAKTTNSLQTASSECQWGNKQFGEFVEDFKIFLEKLNSNNPGKC